MPRWTGLGIILAVFCGSIAVGDLRSGKPPGWTTETLEANLCANPHTQAAINACAEQEYKQADATLNRVYRRVMVQLDNPRKSYLRAAQAAWIKFRDAQCKFEIAESMGGSIAPTLHYGCLTEITKARIVDLEKITKENSSR